MKKRISTLSKKLSKFCREKTFDNEINENFVKYIQDRLGHDRRYAIDSTKIRDKIQDGNLLLNSIKE